MILKDLKGCCFLSLFLFSKTSQEIGGLKIREEGVFPTVKTIGDLF